MRASTVVAMAIATVLAFTGAVQAQPFPTKPLKIVVPFPPGGIGDIMARVLAEDMGKGLGQPVIVDNKPGAGAVLAYEMVARSPADGYTLLLVFPSFVINPSARRVSYDPLKDFKAVGQTISVPMGIAVNSAVPAKSFQELMDLARAKPGELAYGTPGVGTTHHVFTEMLKLAANVNITHAPYQGGGPALTALMGGHIPIVVGNVTELAPHVSSGKIRVLVVTTGDRVEGLDAPTLREVGYPELESANWAGLVVPAATPGTIVGRLSSELMHTLRSPEVLEKLKAQRMAAVPGTPEEFANLLQSESARYSKVIKEAGIKLE